MRGFVLVAFVALTAIASLAILSPTQKKQPLSQKPTLVATINPIAAILREIVGDGFEVRTLLSPASSPHTFEPKPSDMAATEAALAVFYADAGLDGWAAKLGERRVALFDMVPAERRLNFDPESAHVCAGQGHNHGHNHDGITVDPHFWSDPVIVKEMLPRLTRALAQLAPEHRNTFEANAERFATKLEQLHEELSRDLALHTAKPVFLFHPSLLYFLHRYGLTYGGAIEPFAGNSPGPRYLEQLINRLREAKATVVFTEPQLPRQPAEVIAREAGDYPLKVYELDPLGGIEGRQTYAELLRYNARILAEALQ